MNSKAPNAVIGDIIDGVVPVGLASVANYSHETAPHSHAISDVSNLQTSLDGKVNVGDTVSLADWASNATSAANYTFGDGIDLALQGKSDLGHTHAVSDVSGLQGAIDAKADDSSVVKLTGAQTVSDKTLSGTTLTGQTLITGDTLLGSVRLGTRRGRRLE